MIIINYRILLIRQVLCDGYSFCEKQHASEKQPKKKSYKKARITRQDAECYEEFKNRLASK